MKISRIRLEHFKRFPALEISLTNHLTQDISDQFLILGDNGTGKTTVLQAVALCLAMVSGEIRNVFEFNWQGWVAGRYEQWGTPIIELDVCFSNDEIVATQDVAEKWYKSRGYKEDSKYFVRPDDANMVTVCIKGGHYYCDGGMKSVCQFRGRNYALKLLKSNPRARDWFVKLPGVFWFDQYRNLFASLVQSETQALSNKVSGSVGVSNLRQYLNGWWMTKFSSVGTSNWLMDLENSYKLVFPGRSFIGPEPMFRGGSPTPEDYYFMLSDGKRTYDIEEMSAGEQSVFPMLYEFVRMQIKNSVVLIDEIDLNLHPPLAQALLAALPMIGSNCQFILTTHSESIVSMVSPEETHRLPGGRLCL